MARLYRKIIVLFILTLYLAFIFLDLISADNEFYGTYLGDNQTMAGSIGDAQMLSTATTSSPSNVSSQQNQSNGTGGNGNNGGSPGGGGGSGGSGAAINVIPYISSSSLFILSSNNTMRIALKQGDLTSQRITITNTQNQTETISVSTNLGDLIRLSDTSFNLEAGKSKTLEIDFIARGDTVPNFYLGFIEFSAGDYSQTIFATVQVDSSNPLLDVSVSLPVKTVSPGGTLLSGVDLYNLGSEFGDINLNFIIEGYDGNIILNESKTIAIQTQASTIKELQIPKDAPLGHYVLYVRAYYNGKIASSSTEFDISSASPGNEKIYIIILICIVVSAIAGFAGHRIIRKIKNNYKQLKKVDLEDLIWG